MIDIQYICKALNSNNQITSLIMSNVNLSRLQFLCCSIIKSQRIRHLNISWCNIQSNNIKVSYPL
jgi:hypothetical protein